MRELNQEEKVTLLETLKQRFENNMNRHKGVQWDTIQRRLEDNYDKLWSIAQMENTGGEPDVIVVNENEYIFCDCSLESPIGRRSFCYDREALESRKANKPSNSVMDVAKEMGIEVLDELTYRKLQEVGHFDTKTSSWILTPDKIRKLKGALFCDYRYGTVFLYHNGADSYYSARGFRGLVKL